ncbi:MAG: hypothetical protein NTV49_02400 [Kiritimatiellaeota bacterium]|nr:hypothetical protein [Kiritimatiellota bacterium]
MFEAGKSGNPRGRPKGSFGGRIQALAVLDRMLARSKNKRLLERALETEFKADPMKFFKTVCMPLLPKESKVTVDNDGIVEWKSLVEAFPRAGVSVAPAAEEREEGGAFSHG